MTDRCDNGTTTIEDCRVILGQQLLFSISNNSCTPHFHDWGQRAELVYARLKGLGEPLFVEARMLIGWKLEPWYRHHPGFHEQWCMRTLNLLRALDIVYDDGNRPEPRRCQAQVAGRQCKKGAHWFFRFCTQHNHEVEDNRLTNWRLEVYDHAASDSRPTKKGEGRER
jgi:hypothetical protein